MDLDLGTSAKMNVTVEGKTYAVAAPTVRQVEKYQKDSKVEGNEMESFMDLVDTLGMPKVVSEKLDIVQIRKLSDGLLGLVEKK